MSTVGWSEDRVTTMSELWLKGLSASQIANQLGGVTRSAVIGKVYRLGLSDRGGASAPPRVARISPPRPAGPSSDHTSAQPSPGRRLFFRPRPGR